MSTTLDLVGGIPAATAIPPGTKEVPPPFAKATFAEIMASKPSMNKRILPTIVLAPKPMQVLDNHPAFIFSSLEIDQMHKQYDNSLIMKFSNGRPSLQEIRECIASDWGLESTPIVGLLDPRHVTMHMSSPNDVKTALSRNSNIIKTSLYRLFRWSSEFKVGNDSATVPVWIRLPNLPLHFFNVAVLERLGSTLGNVLRIDDRNWDLTQSMFARICVEMDISKPITSRLWIGTSKESGHWQTIQLEGKNAYCIGCGLLGHTICLCRKGPINHQTNKDIDNNKPRYDMKSGHHAIQTLDINKHKQQSFKPKKKERIDKTQTIGDVPSNNNCDNKDEKDKIMEDINKGEKIDGVSNNQSGVVFSDDTQK